MNASSTTPLAPSAKDGAVLHGCVRCGAPVAIDVALCDDCNPLGLAQPAASQVHGIAFVGIVLAVIFLAVAGRLAVSGVGPFDAQVAGVAGVADGLEVTVMVTNRGSRAGATTCTVNDPNARFGGASGYLQSPRIQPGETVTFSGQVTQLGDTPRLLAIHCSNP